MLKNKYYDIVVLSAIQQYEKIEIDLQYERYQVLSVCK